MATADSSRGSWNNLSDDLVFRIVTLIPSPIALKNLACAERRCRAPCSARLNRIITSLLHDTARSGDTHRISSLFHRWHLPVLLKSDGGTILHTALTARRLDLVQWLVQPLSMRGKYLPLSSQVIAPTYGMELEITPRPLPKGYCCRMMAADGVPALRKAAERGDVEMLDRLLPLLSSYAYVSPKEGGGVSRELMMEMRDALIAYAAVDGNDHDNAVTRAAIIMDMRLRCSDIERTFRHFELEKIENLFARDQAQPHQQVGQLFHWLPFGSLHWRELDFLNFSVTHVAGLGRVDLLEWLLDRWGASHQSLNGEKLADLTVISPWSLYQMDRMFEPPHDDGDEDDDDSECETVKNHTFFSMVLRMWGDRKSPPADWNRGTTHQDVDQLDLDQTSPPPCDSTALCTLLRAAERHISTGLSNMSNYRHYDDRKIIKETLALAEPPTDHTPMLNFLLDNDLGRPSLAFLACRGATWALDWMLQQEDFTLEMTTNMVPEDLRFRLNDAVPWLTKNLEKRLPIGAVLAAACASHGAVAMLEKLSHANTNYPRTRLHRGRTLLHLAARHRQRATTIWLVENGYADLLRCRSRGRPLEKPFRHSEKCTSWACARACSAATPLLDAVVGGDPEIIRYLVDRGGAEGEPGGVSGGALWEEAALGSQCKEVRDVAMASRAERILDVTVPHLLRSDAPIADIRVLMVLEGVHDQLSYNLSRIRTLVQAAMVGKREDFLRFMYEPHGDNPPYIGIQGIDELAGIDFDHIDVCREFVGASGIAMSRMNMLINELKSKSTSSFDCFIELDTLTEELGKLITTGGTVNKILEVVTKIGERLHDDEHSITVYGMRLKSNYFDNGKHSVQFRVENIGSFELFTACAMHGHLHLLRWLLQGKYPPNLTQVGNALAVCLEWGGQTRSVEVLCRHLEAHEVNLDTIQLTDQEHSSNQVGVLDYALNGIVLAQRFGDVAEERTKIIWNNARWLATHTQAQLRPYSFPNQLANYNLSHGREENQRFVLELTRFCVETLGASWRCVGSENESGGRNEGGRTVIQLLLNGCWIEAVSWLAKEHGAPLQGLVVESRGCFSREENQEYCDQLRRLQEEERVAWMRVGVL